MTEKDIEDFFTKKLKEKHELMMGENLTEDELKKIDETVSLARSISNQTIQHLGRSYVSKETFETLLELISQTDISDECVDIIFRRLEEGIKSLNYHEGHIAHLIQELQTTAEKYYRHLLKDLPLNTQLETIEVMVKKEHTAEIKGKVLKSLEIEIQEQIDQNHKTGIADSSNSVNITNSQGEREKLQKELGLNIEKAFLTINYLLEYSKAPAIRKNKKRAEFMSFLTGYSTNTLTQLFSWFEKEKANSQEKSEINEKFNGDMHDVRKWFDSLGLSEIVKMIDNDLEG
jgi:hypothetical protein